MRRMIGRLISVVLSAAMLIGSITVPVSAADLPDVSVGSAYETELEAEAYAEADVELETTGEEELLAEEEITDADPAEEEELLAEEEPGEDPDESEALEEVDEDASLQDTASRDRALRQNVTVRFNDDGTTHYKVVKYSYHDEHGWVKTATNDGYNFTTKVDEDYYQVWFLIEPEEGYTLVGVTCDEAMDIFADTDESKIYLYKRRFSANELHINVTVRSNNEYVNTVQYNDILLDAKLYKVGETEPLTPVNYTDIDGFSVSEYSYLLDKTAKYNLKVTPKQEGVLLGTLDISPRIGICSHIQPKNNAHDYTINSPADGTNFFINCTEYMHFVFKYDESRAGIGSTSANPFTVTRAYYTVPGATAGAADRNINLVASTQKTSGGVYEYAVPINSSNGKTKRVVFNINGQGNGALLYVTDMPGNVYDYDAATGACSISVSSITRGEYVYKVTTTKKDFKVNVKDAFGDPITPVGTTYSINRREDVTILHENSFNVKAGLSSLTLRYPDGTTETIGPLDGDEYTIPAEHISPKYAGKTITASLLTKATVASGQTFMLSVKPEITKVTIQGAQTVTERVGTTTVQYQKITQEVGSSKTYNIVLQANERNTADSLIIKNPDNYAQDAVSASIVDVNKVEIITKKSDPMTLAGTFEIWNNETDQKVADVKVATTQPSWANTPITAVQTASTDVSVTMRVSTPANVKFTDDDDFYYVVNLSTNANTKLKDGYKLRDTEKEDHMIYYKASDVAANGGLITFNPYTDDANVYITESGRGFGTSFNVSVSLVRTASEGYPNGSNVFAKTARPLNAIASTKSPYYSDRIIIKSDLTCNTNLCIGQRNKVGIVDFGTQATYVTNDYWKIKSIKDAQGNDASGYFIYGNIGDVEGNDNVLTDNGIYVDVLSYNYDSWRQTPAGRYAITVETVPYASEATIYINVLNRIENLTLNVQDIKWTPGTTVTSRFSASDVVDNTDNKVLSPKLKYTVGVVTGNPGAWTAGDGELSPVQGLNINPTTGIVTIDRTFTNPYGQYWCVCKPTDYPENRHWAYATFSVRTYTSNIGQVALYVKDGDKYKPIMQAGKISSETEIYATVKDKTGKYLGFNNEPYSSDPSYVKITHPVKAGPHVGAEGCNIGGGGNDVLTYEVSSSAQYPTAPYLRTVTFMGQDGTKAMASYTENYSNGSTDKYDRLRVNNLYFEEILTETNKTMDVTGQLTPGDYIEIALVNSSRKRPEDNGVLAEGTLQVAGATVLERHNNQYMSIVMNSPKATITLVKGTKRTVFTITDNTYALTQPIAPAATNTTIKNNGKEDRVYSGYEYKKDDEINIKLAQPLKLDGLDSTKLSIVLKGSLVDNGYLKGEYDYNSYVVETAANGIKSAKLVLPLENGMKLGTGANTLKVIYKYTDGGTVSYLTRTVTTVTIVPIQFNKTYSIVPSLTMTYYPATGTSPECAMADKSQLKYVGTGIDIIRYTGVESYNTRGVFNTFKDEFKIDSSGGFTMSGGEILNNKNALGVPQATTGWIRGTVHFKDGSTSDFISKVNITFVKAK